jgi:ATP phosphoribosyltransferase
METVLRIAIQKSGRLSEDSLALIKDCGISFNTESRVLKEQATNFPLEFLFVRDDDIPMYIRDGIADVGIVGKNEYDEQGIDLCMLKDLGFAKCRLSVAVPQGAPYDGLSSLEGKRIATSYPHILGEALKKAVCMLRSSRSPDRLRSPLRWASPIASAIWCPPEPRWRPMA